MPPLLQIPYLTQDRFNLWDAREQRRAGAVRHRCTATAAARLAEAIDTDGHIAEEAVDGLIAAIVDAVEMAKDDDVDELVTIATSAVRGTENRRWVAARLSVESGCRAGLPARPGRSTAHVPPRGPDTAGPQG